MGTTAAVSSALPTNLQAALNPPGGKLGKEEFLKILVAQLRHQDPLNPMDGSQFASQLAQFSSLEQLVTLNGAVAGQETRSAEQTLAQNTTLGAALLGHTVLARGNQLDIGTGDRLAVTTDIAGGGGHATVRVLDAYGREVAKHDLGAVGGGRQTLSWSNLAGGAPEVPPGSYTYQVVVTATDGTSVSVTPYATGRVDGIAFENGAVMLRVGQIRIPLASVVEIEPKSPTLSAISSHLERFLP
jgi:flagellar basal-body rod modification protein FlgD